MSVLLREELLSDRAVALAGPARGTLAEALASLAARVERLPTDAVDEAGLEGWARKHAPLHGLVYDATSAFAGGGEEGLQDSLDRAWLSVRAVAVGALIEGAAGKIVLVAPPAGAGPLAGAAAAALENLARTLSVEWARYGITATAVVPVDDAQDEQLAELICFLVSHAGDYFSGCRLELGAWPR